MVLGGAHVHTANEFPSEVIALIDDPEGAPDNEKYTDDDGRRTIGKNGDNAHEEEGHITTTPLLRPTKDSATILLSTGPLSTIWIFPDGNVYPARNSFDFSLSRF